MHEILYRISNKTVTEIDIKSKFNWFYFIFFCFQILLTYFTAAEWLFYVVASFGGFFFRHNFWTLAHGVVFVVVVDIVVAAVVVNVIKWLK